MRAEYVGEGKGQYKNINVAWETGLVVDEEVRENNTRSDLGNAEYRAACDSFLFPAVEEFKPDIILISCGFDGAVHDHLGWSNLTSLMYAYMTKRLIDICPRVLVIQEGGYNVDLLGQHASGVVRALLHGTSPMEDFQPEPTPSDEELGLSQISDIKASDCKPWALADIQRSMKEQQPGWKCLGRKKLK